MAPVPPDTRHVARNLRAARMARGLTQAELGDCAGFHQQRISQFERGLRPSPSDVARLARALHLTTADLLGPPRDPLLAPEVGDAA